MENSEIKKVLDSKSELSKAGITKPFVELSDFYEFLDPKVVEKIKQTTEEDKERIKNSVQSYEYDINGAKNIIDSI